MTDWSRIQRPRQDMPAFVREALAQSGQLEAFRVRPAYQQNDYLAWIGRAKREDTRQRRLDQMIDELRRGNVYMRMRWQGGRN